MALTAEQIEQLDALTKERGEILSLRNHPGWKHFVEFMKKTSDFAYAEMVKASDAANMGKQVGAYHVSLSCVAFPEQRATMINQQIKLLERLGSQQ